MLPTQKKRAFRAPPSTLEVPPTGTKSDPSIFEFESVARSLSNFRLPTGPLECSKPQIAENQTIRAEYVCYPGTNTTSRETKSKQFWQISCSAVDFFTETPRPEFDVGLQLEKQGYPPSTIVEFYRHGKRCLTYTLKECVRGYWADHFLGPVYVTRQKHEQRAKDMAKYRNKPPGG